MIKLTWYVVYLLQFVMEFHAMEHNVCPTIQDYYSIKENPKCWYDFSADSNITDIITKHGYTVETHKVTTPDGYILSIFRIPKCQAAKNVSTKGTIFMQHGHLNSAASFVGRGRDSLAFVLADFGYDVWLGNHRGTEYSENHVNLTVYDKKYWDYSMDEMGLYDVPTQLEYVAKVTNQRGNIVYIGYSMGTSVGLIYSSSFPKQARKTIKLFILLAPVAKLGNAKSIFHRQLQYYVRPLLKILNDFDLIRLASQAKVMKSFFRLVCLERPHLMQFCMSLLGLTFTGPKTQVDPSLFPVFFNQAPAGASFKLFAHLTDFITNNFRRYDYGYENFEKYGTRAPPDYDLSKIKVPVFLMYARNDWIATKEDALILYSNLPALARHGVYEITDPNFNHNDFLYGRNVKHLVYDKILQLLS